MSVIGVRAAQVSALVLGLLLAGCGSGGGGGVVSAPTPTPTASYTKIADMTGDRTFQTGGVQYNGSLTNGSTQAFGSGFTVAYIAASDSYRLTAPDGMTVTFDPSSAQAPDPATPNTRQWVLGNRREVLTMTVPTVGGVALSYTLTGSWLHIDQANQSTVQLAVGGAPTIPSDMPRTGNATYATEIRGTAIQSGVPYALTGNSSATFSANFGNNSVMTALTLSGTQLTLSGSQLVPTQGSVTSFGAFNGTGAISSTGPGFTGTLTGAGGGTGGFSGAFFGPRALEMGYQWYLAGGSFNAVGTTIGVKQ